MQPGGPDPPVELIATSFSEESPRISPDGKWLAYVSDHTGKYEVYVSTYPTLDRRWQVSSGGGVEPVWNPRGGELFFRHEWGVFAVPVAASGGELTLGRAELLFEGPYNRSYGGHAHFDADPRGDRFVMVEENRDEFEFMRLILDWSLDLAE